MKNAWLTIRVAWALTLCLGAAQARAEGEEGKDVPGLSVGAKAPHFALAGQDGREHSLASLLKKGKVALVFYRSADW